jgi:hypothetical protein
VTGTYICAAIALLAAGAMLGVLFVVSLAVHREDRQHSLTTEITGRAALGTRVLTGVYTRTPQPANRGSPPNNLLVQPDLPRKETPP